MKKLVLAIVLCAYALPAAAQLPLRVITLNTKHGGQTPFSIDEQVAVIAAQSPDIVLLQEAQQSQLELYVSRINDSLGSTRWHGMAARHCIGRAPEAGCTKYTDESVMVLSRFPFDETEERLIWGPDAYFYARAVLRAAVRLDETTVVQVYACHLPPLANATDLRVAWVRDFNDWTSGVTGPQIVGGDFNDSPTSPAMTAFAEQYVDAWAAKGGGNGATHSRDGADYKSRIDYLFSSGVDVNDASVPQVAVSDHRPVVATYTVPQGNAAPRGPAMAVNASAAPAASMPNGEAVLIEDSFDSDAGDVEKWPAGIVSGMEDRTVPVVQTGGTLAIGPLFENTSGFHYNGPSSRAVDLSHGGYGQVQLLHGVSGDQANAMFTAVYDFTNFYRIYQSGAAGAQHISVEKKINDIKYPLASVPYDPTSQPTLRIRHDYRPSVGVDDAVFETMATQPTQSMQATQPMQAAQPPQATQPMQAAQPTQPTQPTQPMQAAQPTQAAQATPAAAGFVEVYREHWDPAIQARRIVFEIKAGTSDKEPSPGVAIWDNVRVAVPPVGEP